MIISRITPPIEILVEGLLSQQEPSLRVDYSEEKGRCIIATAPLEKGEYVCEYSSHATYPV